MGLADVDRCKEVGKLTLKDIQLWAGILHSFQPLLPQYTTYEIIL